MPPKAKITKDMIIQAGLKIVQAEGVENLNVRKIASALECSTQPVMYHYNTVSEIKNDIYNAADMLHTAYIMTPDENAHNPLLSIGIRYIRFAEEEKHLFRFLFQSDKFHNSSFHELLDADGNNPVIQPLCLHIGLSVEQAEKIFAVLFNCVHGAASLIANNSITYDETYYENLLKNTMNAMVIFLKGDSKT